MDGIDFGAQPHCPNDDTVMRAVPGGWECPECGQVQQAQDIEGPSDAGDSTIPDD